MKKLEKYIAKVMELISHVKDTWKIFIIGSIISCFMLLLLFNENGQNSSLSDQARNTVVEDYFPPLSGKSEVVNPSIFTTTIPPPFPKIAVIAPEPSIISPISPLSDELETTMFVEAPKPLIFTTTSPPPLASTSINAPEPLIFTVTSPPPLTSTSIFTTTSPPPLTSTSIFTTTTTSQPPLDGTSIMAPEPSIFTTTSSPLLSDEPKNVIPLDKSNLSLVNDILKPNVGLEDVKNFEKAETKPEKKCNIFDGRWVYKPEVEPSYCPLKCPFIEEKMSCKKNGRPDLEYEKWVWEARDCDIPMLNGTDMVEKFRDKRVVLIGDSLNRNMWESLSCIVYSNIPYASSNAQILHDEIPIRTFLKAKEDYNFTVEFFWSPFLVELNKNHESGKRVLVLDKLSPNSKQWPNADIMIFNTGHHWTQIAPKKAWDLFEYKGKLTEKMPLHLAFTRAMRTWANWVEKNVDPKKTTVFYRSISAEHNGMQQHCKIKTQPIMDESYKFAFPRTLVRVVEGVLKGMKKLQVKYLNVTKLTEYRIDAHPSIYRFNDWKIRTKNSRNKNDQPIIPDCGHWCLPGVPDTWNRLLYASLLFDNYGDISSS